MVNWQSGTTTDRREVLGGLAGLGAAAVAGCVGGGSSTGTTPGASDGGSGPGLPPRAETGRHRGHGLSSLRDGIVGGGVSKDGIPSIDEPQFEAADATDLDDGAPVFGVRSGDTARAYPQYILVHHEIVNDSVGGVPVAVTYCPLTGTAQGFERGPVEFGVSGKLVNSNLIMYDRATDSYWSQIAGTAVDGLIPGYVLREFRVVWTTWGEWRAANPDTDVLTEDTGYVRRYGTDPYGGYNPARGYYANDEILFPTLAENDEAHPKAVVLGARTASEAVAFDADSLREQRLLRTETDVESYLAAFDPELSTGYVYADVGETAVEPDGTQYRVEGDRYAAAALPFRRVLAFDAMWFAWAGFYPETTYVE
jgi:hypothetical protein